MKKTHETSKTKAPKTLSGKGLTLWRDVSKDCHSPVELRVLQSACEALQRMRQAQEVIAKEGLTQIDRFGQIKPRPELSVERDCRDSMLRHLRALGVERLVNTAEDDNSFAKFAGLDKLKNQRV